MKLPGFVLSISGDLARIIDRRRHDKVPTGIRVNHAVQGGHLSIAIDKGGVTAVRPGGRAADDLSSVVHTIGPIALCG